MTLTCWDKGGKQDKQWNEMSHLHHLYELEHIYYHKLNCVFQLLFVSCYKTTSCTRFQTPHIYRCMYVHSLTLKRGQPKTLKESQRTHLCLDTNTCNKLVRCLCQDFKMSEWKERAEEERQAKQGYFVKHAQIPRSLQCILNLQQTCAKKKTKMN